MRPRDFPVALIALVGLVAVVPAWAYYIGSSGLPPQAQWIAGLTLPAGVIITAVSWMRPEMARAVTGVFVLAGVMALAPQLWALNDMAAGASGLGGLAESALSLALPLLVLTFVLSLGWQRIEGVVRR